MYEYKNLNVVYSAASSNWLAVNCVVNKRGTRAAL